MISSPKEYISPWLGLGLGLGLELGRGSKYFGGPNFCDRRPILADRGTSKFFAHAFIY